MEGQTSDESAVQRKVYKPSSLLCKHLQPGTFMVNRWWMYHIVSIVPEHDGKMNVMYVVFPRNTISVPGSSGMQLVRCSMSPDSKFLCDTAVEFFYIDANSPCIG